MKLKTCFIVLLFITIIQSLFAQHITGHIVESESKEPMPYVDVFLLHATDSTEIAGTISDAAGYFQLPDIVPGKYILQFHFLGFESQTISAFTHEVMTDIGSIAMYPSAILLEDVQITAKRNSLHSIDKKVLYADKDIVGGSGSATDLLQNIPAISVDVNGGITLRGTSNITFLINGRPSAILRRNATGVLQNMPAGGIKRIELITNPSAKYRPDGVGGIINIVLKKENKQGVNSTLSANAGNEDRYNVGFNLNYGTEDWNAYAGYTFRRSGSKVLFADDRKHKNVENGSVFAKYIETGNSRSKPLSHIANAGFSFDIDDANSMELSGTYFLSNNMHSGNANIYLQRLDTAYTSVFHTKNTNDEFESEGEVALVLEHVFAENEDHVLAIEGALALFDESEDLMFREEHSIPTEEQRIKNIYIKKTGHQLEVTADYTLPVSEDIEVELGYGGEFIEEDIRYRNTDNANRFVFNQNVHALYSIYGQSIENFSFQIGLRGEQALVNAHLVEPTDSTIKNETLKLYPSAHIALEAGDNNEVRLSYSKRINRPDADELNPFAEFTDPRNAEAGNPHLQPEQIHSAELAYSTRIETLRFSPVLYYRYKYDAFTSIARPVGDSVIISTIANLDNRQSTGLELILSGKIKSFADFDLSGNVFYTTIDAQNIGYSDKKSVLSSRLRLHTLFYITKTTFLQADLNFYGARLTPQGRHKPIFFTNIGLKQQLLNKRLALILTATDVLHTYKSRYVFDGLDIVQNFEVYRKNPVFYIGASWRFGKNYQEGGEKLDFEGAGARK